MEQFDRHIGIFASKLHEHDPPTWFESLANILHHFERKIELVINIHHQHSINCGGRQFWILNSAEHRFHVGNLKLSHFVGQNIEHLLLDLDSIDDPLCA